MKYQKKKKDVDLVMESVIRFKNIITDVSNSMVTNLQKLLIMYIKFKYNSLYGLKHTAIKLESIS